jgi:hypothetical protein
MDRVELLEFRIRPQHHHLTEHNLAPIHSRLRQLYFQHRQYSQQVRQQTLPSYFHQIRQLPQPHLLPH